MTDRTEAPEAESEAPQSRPAAHGEKTFHFYEVARGHRLAHDPLKAIVAPRPVGWITTLDAAGRVNLAPYSFFNAVHTNPPIVMFSSEGWKDSVANCQATGEFVANLATRPLAEAMNTTSAGVPHGMNEMELAGLAAAPCRLVRPPRVAAAPAALECKVLDIQQLKDLDERTLQGWLVLGQVVAVHIDTEYIRDGRFDTAGARPIARCGYRGDYAEVTELFEMIRPG
jgi:flavin reductase (DIM6/NTAB) family NADH-FMN oxidoreductase RutF